MKFWEQHEQSMRKAKLLQAAAVIYSTGMQGKCQAVDAALELEKYLEERLHESPEPV
jgi:hypothetical protein